jgi:alkanesulfonate monooxygenase SsuD/methylene tetrahydromethanopterin reductase-like flavin-dependent oxidoreductase (luciferase family)
MKLGVLVESEEGLSWARWRALVSTVERLGFESLWISDHLQSPHRVGVRGIDPWLALSVAAAESSGLRLGTLVSPITFYEPALVARMAGSLQALSDGRFVLGLGLGWNDDEHRAHGIAFPSVRERVARLTAAIELVRAHVEEQQVPLLLGGGGERASLPLVARYADEWNLTTASPELFSAKFAVLEQLCTETRRDVRTIGTSVALGFLVGRNAAELAERARAMAPSVPQLAGLGQSDIHQVARGMGWVCGTPSDIADHLRELAKAGVQRAIFGHYLQEDDAALELIATAVMPVLQEV